MTAPTGDDEVDKDATVAEEGDSVGPDPNDDGAENEQDFSVKAGEGNTDNQDGIATDSSDSELENQDVNSAEEGVGNQVGQPSDLKTNQEDYKFENVSFRAETGTSDNVATNSSVIQFLALYLLVLAFFIWLVSLARFEGVKSLAVINSLKSTFEAEKEEDSSVNLRTLIRSKVMNSRQFEDNIRGLFSTLLGVEKVDAPTPGRTMRVVMTADTLFEPEKTNIREHNFPFMDRVIASLSERPPGYHFDMEFIIGSDGDASGYGTLPVTQTLQMARAGVFVRSMLARGAPPDTVSVGIRKGNPNSVTMWFYIRSPIEVEAYYNKLRNPASSLRDGESSLEPAGERTVNGG